MMRTPPAADCPKDTSGKSQQSLRSQLVVVDELGLDLARPPTVLTQLKASSMHLRTFG